MKKILIKSLLLVFLLTSLLVACEYPDSQTVEVHFINVGEGDATLIRCHTGVNVLIDAGDQYLATSLMLIEHLKSNGVDTLHVFVATHFHADHIGGFRHLAEVFPILKVIDNGEIHTSLTYGNYRHAIDKHNIPRKVKKEGDKIVAGTLDLRIIHPDSTEGRNYSLNDGSLVIVLEHGVHRFMFTGDIEERAENDIIARLGFYAVTVLKVAHHGSSTSTQQAFLSAVSPEFAVISVGEGNRYGHPATEVVNRLKDNNVRVYRTDLHGTVLFLSDGNRLRKWR